MSIPCPANRRAGAAIATSPSARLVSLTAQARLLLHRALASSHPPCAIGASVLVRLGAISGGSIQLTHSVGAQKPSPYGAGSAPRVTNPRLVALLCAVGAPGLTRARELFSSVVRFVPLRFSSVFFFI